MELRINRSPKSVTLHIDTKEDARKLAADLLRAAEHDDAFPGTTLVMIVPGKRVHGKQEFANTSLRCGVPVSKAAERAADKAAEQKTPGH